jgi:hypothetical protein
MDIALDTYLRERSISDAEFGAIINRDRTIVSKLRRGVLLPTLEVAGAIEVATDGQVPMQAWVGQTRPPESAAA